MLQIYFLQKGMKIQNIQSFSTEDPYLNQTENNLSNYFQFNIKGGSNKHHFKYIIKMLFHYTNV